jgi:MOSC domain-containing protein YiiM
MFELFKSSRPVKLHSIFICKSAGQAMEAVSSILAIENEGLSGDRYQTHKGYWDPVEGCQVTVITMHELNRAQKKTHVSFDSGQHRRNLVLDSVHPKKLINRKIQIGEAVFQYDKPRPPCGYLDQLVMKGTAKALGKNSGFCFKVVTSGLIKVGDDVVIIS